MIWHFLKKLCLNFPRDLAIPLPETYPWKTNTCTQPCTVYECSQQSCPSQPHPGSDPDVRQGTEGWAECGLATRRTDATEQWQRMHCWHRVQTALVHLRNTLLSERSQTLGPRTVRSYSWRCPEEANAQRQKAGQRLPGTGVEVEIDKGFVKVMEMD